MTVTVRPPEDRVDSAVRGLFSRDSLYSLFWAVQAVSAAVTTPILTRVLGPSEFGEVAASIAVMQVLFVLAGMGLETAVQRSWAERGGQAARRLAGFAVVVAVAVTAVVDATGRWWAPLLGPASYEGTPRLAVLWAGLSALVSVGTALLRCADRLRAFAATSLVLAVGGAVAGVGLALATDRSGESYVRGQLLAVALAVVIGFGFARPTMVRRADRAMVLGALRFAIPLVPVGLNAFVLGGSDRLVVANMLGLAEVGRYQVAYNIGSLPILLVTMLSWAWLPRIMALDEDSDRPAVLAASRDGLLRILAPVVVGLTVAAPLLLRIWSPASYDVDRLLLVTCVVVATVIPYTASIMVENALTAAGRTGVVAACTTASAAVNVGLNLVLIPVAGLTGSALATFGSYVLQLAAMSMIARRVAPVRPSPTSVRLLLLLCCAVAVASTVGPTDVAALVVRGVVALAMLGWFVVLGSGLARGPRGRRTPTRVTPGRHGEAGPGS